MFNISKAKSKLHVAVIYENQKHDCFDIFVYILHFTRILSLIGSEKNHRKHKSIKLIILF